MEKTSGARSVRFPRFEKVSPGAGSSLGSEGLRKMQAEQGLRVEDRVVELDLDDEIEPAVLLRPSASRKEWEDPDLRSDDETLRDVSRVFHSQKVE